MFDQATTNRSQFQAVADVIDELLRQLCQCDQEMILLHYYCNCTLEEVATKTGKTRRKSEESVNRAVGNLAMLLQIRGIAVSAKQLDAFLATQVGLDPPLGLLGEIIDRVSQLEE